MLLLYAQDVLFTQSPTPRDFGKGWEPLQDSKQEIVIFKYVCTVTVIVEWLIYAHEAKKVILNNMKEME